jgi:tetratricopeptide (TPR) repeat protein
MQRFRLPNSGLEVSCALDLFQDAQPYDYSMTSAPEMFVTMTGRDFKENRDPVLERALNYESYGQLREKFFASMSGAYRDGGIGKVKEVYETLKREYVEYGFNTEVLLYEDLDGWMGKNRNSDEEYLTFLKFIHGELPNSIKVSYDLAYWMNKSGNREEAKELYERCMVLNPEHHHAKWRLGLMELEERWEGEE